MTYLPSKFPVDPPVSLNNTTGLHLAQGGGGQNTTPIYTDRAGRWMFYMEVSGNINSQSDNQGMNWAVRLNGANRVTGKYMIQDNTTSGVVLGWGQYMDMAASSQWYFAMSQDYFLIGDISIIQYLFFVPTLATPR